MSQALITIATGVVALVVGRLAAWPTIRRLRAARADAAWLLGHDPLTGMFNRAGLYRAHTLAVTEDAQPIQVLLIDLDNFKTVNDTYGHDAGDDVLVEIGDRITDAADIYGGIAARLAGDEFAALLPVRAHDLASVSDVFVQTIAQPVELTRDGTPIAISITASIGAAFAETSDPIDTVALRRADIAMYHAKHRGGNQHAHYQPGMTMPTNARRKGPRLRDLRHHRREVGTE